jgi:hypothetical protein
MIDADTRQRAKFPAIEHDHERRLQLALCNRRQRDLYGPKHRRSAASSPDASSVGRSSSAPDARCRSGQISCGTLGHDDRDPSWTRPEHRTCNRAAANALKTSRVW